MNNPQYTFTFLGLLGLGLLGFVLAGTDSVGPLVLYLLMALILLILLVHYKSAIAVFLKQS